MHVWGLLWLTALSSHSTESLIRIFSTPFQLHILVASDLAGSEYKYGNINISKPKYIAMYSYIATIVYDFYIDVCVTVCMCVRMCVCVSAPKAI